MERCAQKKVLSHLIKSFVRNSTLYANADTKDQRSTMPVESAARRFLTYRTYYLVPDPSRICGKELRNVMYVTLVRVLTEDRLSVSDAI